MEEIILYILKFGDEVLSLLNDFWISGIKNCYKKEAVLIMWFFLQ